MTTNSQKVRLIFGLKLKQLRQEKGIQLNELATRSGLSASYLNEIEKGKKYPKSEKIFTLAAALGTDYDSLVSLKVSKKLEPIAELLNSNILQELPLEWFGIEPADLLQMLSDAPSRISSFINTLIEISRSHGMNVEQFYFSALRSYQELHNNYFEDIETAAGEFLDQHLPASAPSLDYRQLRQILESEFDYQIAPFEEKERPELSGLRSVLVPGARKVLLVNNALEPEQLAFTYGREMGYHYLQITDRPLVSSVVEAESFEQVLNNFRASYFAGAILVPRQALTESLPRLFGGPHWNPDALLRFMYSFHATPEVFLHRLSQVMTSQAGISQFFFLRFDHKAGEDHFRLTKELNLDPMFNLHGAANEHFCRRSVAVTILQELAGLQASGIWNGQALCRSQVVEYMDTGKQYWVLALAKPSPPKGHNSSVSLWFTLDESFRSLARFLADAPAQPVYVNETCERCGDLSCPERAYPPVIWQRTRRNQALKQTLEKLKHGINP